MLVLLATLTSSKVEVISLSHLSDLSPYLRYGSYLMSLFALLSTFSVQTQVTISAFLYVQLPFLPMLLRNQTATPRPVKGEKTARAACSRVRANRNDSPAALGVLWQRGWNPTLTPGDGFERAELCRSLGHFANKQSRFHPQWELSMHLSVLKPRGFCLDPSTDPACFHQWLLNWAQPPLQEAPKLLSGSKEKWLPEERNALLCPSSQGFSLNWSNINDMIQGRI